VTPRVPKQTSCKQRVDLLPWPALDVVAEVMTRGSEKYSERGYYGMSLMQLFAAAIRHLKCWVLGEDLDKEWGLPHLAHAAACVLMMLELVLVREGDDDRPYHLQVVAKTPDTR
jgi:Domain of unknown function (DUF5664)